ncbi:GNAT family N-acetyltransferase [Amycolatopsis magusensis]|uniref:RimJ/RimL family protein N-acetyltransferase n=1 Tax=Amycolatopsis magusensis TaxID=882444 RepID=A0ABS4PGF8_9PSEU|nr:GNAT family N-acetyltransferase [Amycolatopsis magusensis]MBP2178485.1 RimJ/RimL family protein N-acetyltransferase [Amycolatopsis magusensis]MDI5982471.1 GNAT family N-acetyltransferase [Amycolatopsis magusensis]
MTTFHAIHTERLILRPLRLDDREAVVRIQSDPETNRFNPDPPDVRQAGKQFEYWLSHWEEHGYGYFAVVEAATGEVAGVGGVQSKEMHDEQLVNLYYRFRPQSWGKGYATEMARAAVEWAERALPDRPVVISVALVNEPSRRVAEKLGFTPYLEEDYQGQRSTHYRRSLSTMVT